jgi:hypothetical protein
VEDFPPEKGCSAAGKSFLIRMPENTTSPTCPHGLRPGTTVCLHCRQDARAAARQRRTQLVARFTLITLGVGLVVALIVGGIMAIAPNGTDPMADSPRVIATTDSSGAPAAPQPRGVQPIIGEGRNDLVDSVYALREGQQVTVYFDTESLRTRFDWKFEAVVRTTLPLIFGPDARTALDSIPQGTWVRGGALLTELPQRGIPLAAGEERLRIWPITRQGRDGPLVVAYRVRVE